ncbi:uncharacterized protein N7479_008950 [Penicillium vulpinum]|uniref:Transposase Tc1-like domain-containing protein n=1 Tax=Penicillium vulpinum TaxID=29845 RepID=A0A1V6R9Q3_9EURO|nr:uncharacterized protein N7479_008950 [Penicillium vulpinum]KAJ5950537.1 hypothetical protein N7479_008950 [Penicillium vulpinum]OQD98280.1 hypothetical protein PENVUL_c072G09884 [Penicillium vulpinum]
MVPRTPLRPINSNGRRNTELTPKFRVKITEHEFELSYAKIAARHGLSASIVQYTVEQERLLRDGHSMPRSGRPKALTEGDKRAVIRIIKRDPFAGSDDIREQSGTTACNKTIFSMLRDEKYDHWEAQKRPRLKAELAAKRLA